MHLEDLRLFALALPGATEDFPFDEHTLALRVGGKIFALLALDAVPPSFNAKCDPERAIELRDTWPAIRPGYHMNKKHWNTVTLDGSVPPALIEELVRHAHTLVWRSLPRKDRDGIPLDG